jgi:uncharacterized membrane protein YkvA (DUF1232 family)
MNNEMMDNIEANMLMYAARYAHNRDTGAALQIVSYILSVKDLIPPEIFRKLQEEADYATTNFEDWQKLKDAEQGK